MFAQRYFETSLVASVALWLPVGVLIAFIQYGYSVPYFFAAAFTPGLIYLLLREWPGGQQLTGRHRLLVETGLFGVAGASLALITQAWEDSFNGESFTHLSRGLMYGCGAGAGWYVGAMARAGKKRRGPLKDLKDGGGVFMIALGAGMGTFVGWVATMYFTFIWTWDAVSLLSFLPVPLALIVLTMLAFAPIGAFLSVVGSEAAAGKLTGETYGGGGGHRGSYSDYGTGSSSRDYDDD